MQKLTIGVLVQMVLALMLAAGVFMLVPRDVSTGERSTSRP